MKTLPIGALEQVYDKLAIAIDQVPAAKSELFLVKLVMLLANEVADAARFEELASQALQNIDSI